MKQLRVATSFCYLRGVARLLTLLAGLAMVLSLGMASVVHAAEPQGGFTIEASTSTLVSAGHSQNDADEVPADADKGFAHHHGGCHGDHHVAPVGLDAAVAHVDARTIPTSGRATRLMPLVPDPRLRPPTA